MRSALICLCFAVIVAGCSGGDSKPPLSSDQEKQATQIDEFAKKSNGDWNKLSAAEQKQMIMLGGSEQGAKMLLLAKTGKLGRHGPPGGPPGGPVGGGPPGGGR